MPARRSRDAVIVGSGPNGLAAAITLSSRGYAVRVLEGAEQIGGGMRSEAATLPGFVHDTCSSVYPFAAASPFFRSLGLERHGLEWIRPAFAVAHPLDDGRVALAAGSVADTASGLGGDGAAYAKLMGPLVDNAGLLMRHLLGPVRIPADPLPLARFGILGIRSARSVIEDRFTGDPARALIAGSAAHSMLPLDAPATAAFGLLLTMCAHTNGWPFARGGAQTLAVALASRLRADGGRIETGRWVRRLDEVDRDGPLLLDVAPWNMLEMGTFPERYARALRRYRLGPGVLKVDYALDGPVPWTARECALAGTVHVGGTFEQICEAEDIVHAGGVPERPFVLVAQPSPFDPTRAPEGKHVLWAYCHVPNGWTEDESHRIDAQIERFAPGFTSRIIGRRVMLPKDFEAHNPNLMGGDIGNGSQALIQLLTRPMPRINPYKTPIDGVYLCSAATPPGTGVHGMSGYRAALTAASESRFAGLKRRLP